MKILIRQYTRQPIAALIVLLFLFLSLDKVACQEFGLSVVGGGNFSQLDGDNLQGFNKLGAHLGLRSYYSTSSSSGFGIELLLHEKGSSTGIIQGGSGIQQSISLRYVSIPITYFLNEWYVSDTDHHRVRIEAGPIMNYLFDVSSSNPFFDNAVDDFANFDLGLLAGLSYNFDSHWTVTGRVERSLLTIYQGPTQQERGLQSYLMNFRFEYEF